MAKKILLTVWTSVPPQHRDAWNKYTRETHLPQIMEKSHFLSARRFAAKDGPAPGDYVTMYEIDSMETLKRYQEGPSKELRADYEKHWGATTKVTRIILEEID